MKPPIALLLGTAALAAGLAGCGQPGPLYMPKPPAKAPAKPAPAATAPAAATPSSPSPAAQQ